MGVLCLVCLAGFALPSTLSHPPPSPPVSVVVERLWVEGCCVPGLLGLGSHFGEPLSPA